MTTITLNRARRLALAAQGFGRERPSGSIDVRHFRRVLEHVGLVQLDSVNVVSRSHYLPFFARLGPYPQDALDRWLWRSGELFEYWGHEASLLPMTDWGLMHHRMTAATPWRRVRAIMSERPGFVEGVLDEVRRRGPTTVSHVGEPGERTGSWWGWGPGKIVLEWHFISGALTVADRPNFTRVYDLTERVIPAEVREGPHPDTSEARRALLRRAVRHHGIGSVTDLADYYRLKTTDARHLLAELAAAGDIEEVEVPGWRGPVYRDPTRSIPNRIEGRALLSPFDPVVWFRDRAERLFGFRYRIEIYVPAAKRVHGYYVLPFLLDGDLVARVDLKADRAHGRLLVRGAFVEDGVDRMRVASELAAELELMAGWLGLSAIEVGRNGDLAPSVIAALG